MTYCNWRQHRRRGCRGHIPQYFGWGDVNGNIPPILLRTFGYCRPILVALRSLGLKPISFGYKTPPIRYSQAGGQSAHKARPPNLELALTSPPPGIQAVHDTASTSGPSSCHIHNAIVWVVRRTGVYTMPSCGWSEARLKTPLERT